MPFSQRLKFLFQGEKALLFTIKEFAHANKNLLIIVCDPKSDRMFATYKDKFVNGRIKSPLGKKSHVVREVLKFSRFDESIDMYLTAIMETLHLPVWKANQFYQWLDAAIFNLAKSMRRKDPMRKSPIQPKDLVDVGLYGESSELV